jgi:hypothetical protein
MPEETEQERLEREQIEADAANELAAKEAAEKEAASARKKKKDHTIGLVLDLGGAPDVPHSVGDYGMFRPDVPTPCGGPGEPSVELALRVDADEGCPLKIVQIPDQEVPRLREQAEADRRTERGLPPRQESE